MASPQPIEGPRLEAGLAETVVECEGLQKVYRRGKTLTTALAEATLTIRQNEFILISGESGSGKSTLLRLVGCLDRPTGGFLRLFGRDVGDLSERELTRIRRNRLSFIFQDLNLIPVMSALENVAYPLARRGAPNANARARELLEQVGLGNRLHATPQQLSGGEQQRAAVARCFAQDPELILADEPTGALDSDNTASVFRLLREFCDSRRGAVLLVSHDPNARRWADRPFAVSDGRLAAS